VAELFRIELKPWNDVSTLAMSSMTKLQNIRSQQNSCRILSSF
jgi:hypothetical protein